MNKREYQIYNEGRHDAENGAGLSDCKRGYHDGDLDAWRQGVWSILDAQDTEANQ